MFRFIDKTWLTFYEFKEQKLEMPSYRYRVILWLIADVSEEILSETPSPPQSSKVLPVSKYLATED